MQQITQNDRVVDVGRRGHHGVNQFAFAVDPDMGLHAEVPLIAFARLMHVRVRAIALWFRDQIQQM